MCVRERKREGEKEGERGNGLKRMAEFNLFDMPIMRQNDTYIRNGWLLKEQEREYQW
jgi:hypothetical protein